MIHVQVHSLTLSRQHSENKINIKSAKLGVSTKTHNNFILNWACFQNNISANGSMDIANSIGRWLYNVLYEFMNTSSFIKKTVKRNFDMAFKHFDHNWYESQQKTQLHAYCIPYFLD